MRNLGDFEKEVLFFTDVQHKFKADICLEMLSDSKCFGYVVDEFPQLRAQHISTCVHDAHHCRISHHC